MRRTRGLIHWASDQAAADEAPIGAFGMCVVTADALAAGAASVPGPLSDDESDVWFVHQYMFQDYELVSASGSLNMGVQYMIDSKAMRKVNASQAIALVVEAGATFGAVFHFGIRIASTITRG